MICPLFLRSTQRKYRYLAISYSFILFALVTSSFVQIKASHPARYSAAAVKPDTDAVDRAQEGGIQPLEPGRPIERELAGGQSHYYRLALNAGQYLRLTVDQR